VTQARFYTDALAARIHASYLPAKLLWWREHDPAKLESSARVVSLKEYVVHRLCGDYYLELLLRARIVV